MISRTSIEKGDRVGKFFQKLLCIGNTVGAIMDAQQKKTF